MTGKPLRLLMSLLLSGVMPTGGSGLPSYCHSHAGGDHAHHHADDCAAHQNDTHPFGQNDIEHDSTLMEAAVAHVHFCWFGFEFSLPLDCEDDNEDQPATVLALGQSQQFVATVSSSTELVPHQQTGIAFATFVVAEQPIRGTISQILAPPLCAKARHERSGVQLI